MAEVKATRRTGRRFSEEFKRDAVELVRSMGRTIAQAAQELGSSDTTLGNCVARPSVTTVNARACPVTSGPGCVRPPSCVKKSRETPLAPPGRMPCPPPRRSQRVSGSAGRPTEFRPLNTRSGLWPPASPNPPQAAPETSRLRSGRRRPPAPARDARQPRPGGPSRPGGRTGALP